MWQNSKLNYTTVDSDKKDYLPTYIQTVQCNGRDGPCKHCMYKPPKESEESEESDEDSPEHDPFSIGKLPSYDDWVEEYLKKTNISGISGRCRCDGPTYCPWCGK